MKVGDLVICKYVEGKPVGIILNVRWRKVGNIKGARVQVYDVFMEGDRYPFQAHLVEAI